MMAYKQVNLYNFFMLIVAIFFFGNTRAGAPVNFDTSCDIFFDISMDKNNHLHLLNHQSMQMLYTYFKSLYLQSSSAIITPTQKPRIPLIIHVIWFGGKLPQEYHGFYQSWLEKHPEWTIIFWTDNEKNYDQGVRVYGFESLRELLDNKKLYNSRFVIDVADCTFENKIFFDQADNYGEKSDILKWEVVYQFGGLYVDVDFECIKNLDNLHYRYDFYTGIQPLDTNCVQLGAALFAARPRHPILQHCVETIKDDRDKEQIVVKTGPIHFTRSCIAVSNQLYNDIHTIIFPATYFYPCSYEQRGQPSNVWLRPESYAVHHWAGSWLKPEAFVAH